MPRSLAELVAALDGLAPLRLAADWDNVGLLVEPTLDAGVSRALLTIDLDDRVLEEAIESGCELVIAYHPPLFRPLKRLRASAAVESRLIRAISANLAIVSPHTALDAAIDGLNDWLAGGLRGTAIRRPAATRVGSEEHPGIARCVDFDRPLDRDELLRRVKDHLGVTDLRVAEPRSPRPIRSVALCAGAGASAILDIPADAYLTGEMRHHDVLAALEQGATIVLCEHSSSERAYLPVLAQRLSNVLPDVHFLVSSQDREPIRIA
ncbi:MAG: Nif3-like dinuclear metal center hexameric protein [Planctomycetota bacterium]